MLFFLGVIGGLIWGLIRALTNYWIWIAVTVATGTWKRWGATDSIKTTAVVFVLLLIPASMICAFGCGGGGASTPSPTPTPSPATTPTPTPIMTPAPTATLAPTYTPNPTQVWPLGFIPEEILNECAWLFLTENHQVTGATAYQYSPDGTIFLPFSIDWATSIAEVKVLAEQFIRLVKSRVDTPPGIEIGSGKYKYITYVNHQNGLLMIQGSKCAECSTITWY